MVLAKKMLCVCVYVCEREKPYGVPAIYLELFNKIERIGNIIDPDLVTQLLWILSKSSR